MVIGLKNLVWFPLLTDPEGGPPTYGTPVALAGAIDVQITPDGGEANRQYADDVEYDSITPDTEYRIDVETAGFSVANQAMLQGHAVAADGGMVIRSGDEPPYGAIAFKSPKSAKAGGGFRYTVIYKVKPSFLPMAYHTKENKSITRQNAKMSLSGIPRIADGFKQYVVDAASDPSGFFTTPHTPVIAGEIAITTQPADLALANGAGGTLSIVAEVDGGAPDAYRWYKAAGRTYAGAVASAYTGNAGASLTIPTNIAAGVHYFFCKLTNAGSQDKYSDIAVVIVAAS